MNVRAVSHLKGVIAPCFSQVNHAVVLPSVFWGCNQQQYRGMKPNKHWWPKFKPLRRLKIIKVELPDFEEDNKKDVGPEEIRKKMKEKGIQPGRQWVERPYEISATGDVFEPYVPPEGDGKASLISTEGAKQSAEMVTKKSKSWMAFRKIRQFDEDFDTSEFAQHAQQIYIDVHKAVASQDSKGLCTLVTERAYPEVVFNMKLKTVHWKFLESLEPPRVVHARCTDVISKENVFGQVTCRFHTKQILAVYDRFGRLSHGSEVIAKDVLEYVVFEKHLANLYGIWRIHAKITPAWAQSEDLSPRTFRVAV